MSALGGLLGSIGRTVLPVMHDADLRDRDEARRAERDAEFEDDAFEVVEQLRRRREASYRLPPRYDGKRDPWDPRPSDAPDSGEP